MPKKSYSLTPIQIINILKSHRFKRKEKQRSIVIMEDNNNIQIQVDISVHKYTRDGIDAIIKRSKLTPVKFLKSISTTKALSKTHSPSKVGHRPKQKKKKKDFQNGKGSRKYYKS